MLVDQSDETLEQFVLPVGAFDLFAGEPAVGLVVDIEKKTLQMVAGNDIAETMFPVFINSLGGSHKAAYPLGAIVRKREARFFFQEMEEGGLETEGHFS